MRGTSAGENKGILNDRTHYPDGSKGDKGGVEGAGEMCGSADKQPDPRHHPHTQHQTLFKFKCQSEVGHLKVGHVKIHPFNHQCELLNKK